MAITQEIDLHVQAMAKKYGVPVNLVRAVIGKESGQKQGKNSPDDPVANYWSADQNARSPAGAMGLMQLMPGTASELGVNPADVKQNIEGGVKYLAQQMKTFGGDTAKTLAAYNAGPGNVRKHNGVPPFRETQNYVAKINGWLPAMDTAFAGGKGEVPDTTGVPSVDGTGTGAASNAGAAGTDTAAAVQERYSAIGEGYKKSQSAQLAYADNIAKMAGAAPDLAASVSESLAASNAALANFSAGSRATVDRTFAELEQKDIARRMIMQNMLTDKNLDPTVQGSIADMSTDNMAMLNRRMNATILAEQATNEMSITDNPAGFFEKMLFGNLYTQGRNELRSQFNDLQAVTDGTLATVNAQAKQATDVKIGDPAQLQGRQSLYHPPKSGWFPNPLPLLSRSHNPSRSAPAKQRACHSPGRRLPVAGSPLRWLCRCHRLLSRSRCCYKTLPVSMRCCRRWQSKSRQILSRIHL